MAMVFVVPYLFTSGLFDAEMAGTRVAQSCGSGSNYFSLIDECVPLSIASTAAFLSSFRQTKSCIGGVVDSVAALEGLRFCNTIVGMLDIEVGNLEADFTSLYDIGTITGVFMVL